MFLFISRDLFDGIRQPLVSLKVTAAASLLGGRWTLDITPENLLKLDLTIYIK